ncbi:MAG: tetratricopeptide repeat protein [bacterium]
MATDKKSYLTLLVLILQLTWSACGTGYKGTNAHNNVDFPAHAESLYSITPRTWQAVEKAYQLMSKAAQSHNGKSQAYDPLFKAAKYALWLSYNSQQKTEKSRYASEAMRFAGQAIQIDQNRVEGYYARAIATGLFAQANKITARGAMRKIRSDALKAIKIDATFDSAGPHRLLGALYLRAPGPPAGIGSRRKALEHFEAAYRIAPAHPENMNFLAEVYLKLDRIKEATVLLQKALDSSWPDGDLVTKEARRKKSLQMLHEIEAK